MARQMIYMENCARSAERVKDTTRAQYMWARRAWIAEKRSGLMREMWDAQRQQAQETPC